MKVVVIKAAAGTKSTAVYLGQVVSVRKGTGTSVSYIAGATVKSILSDGVNVVVSVAFPDSINTSAFTLELATMLRTGTSSANYKYLLSGTVKGVGVTSNA